MVGILVIAHAPLASALSQCVEHVYSCEPDLARANMRVLDIVPGSDSKVNFERANELLKEIEHESGVLVLTDVFGATPGNLAARLSQPQRVVVIAGVNVPMLLRAVCYRGGSLAEVAEKALAGGQQGMIQVASATPVQNQTFTPQGDDQQRLHHQ